MDDPAIRPPHPLCTAVPLYSSAALTYADAQTRMDDPTLTDELTISLRTLNRIGKVSGGGGCCKSSSLVIVLNRLAEYVIACP